MTEDDLLQIVDTALSQHPIKSGEGQASDLSNAHILCGLEKKEQYRQFYRGYQVWKADARFSVLAEADTTHDDMHASTAEDPLHALVQQVRDTGDHESLKAAILASIADKLTDLILMPKDKITSDLSLSNIGMDSLLAAEFRTFLFQTYKVDVPFLTLLDIKTSIGDVTQLICDRLLAPPFDEYISERREKD